MTSFHFVLYNGGDTPSEESLIELDSEFEARQLAAQTLVDMVRDEAEKAVDVSFTIRVSDRDKNALFSTRLALSFDEKNQ